MSNDKKKAPFTEPSESYQQAHTWLVCSVCGKRVQEKRGKYSRTAEGATQFLCWKCDATRPGREQDARRKAEAAEKFKDIVRAMGKVNAPTISDLCMELIAEAGSVEKFAKFYWSQLTAAASTDGGKGSARVLGGCAAIAKIVAMSTAYQATLPEVSQLTDDQLAEAYEQGMVSALQRLPPSEIERLMEQANVTVLEHKDHGNGLAITG